MAQIQGDFSLAEYIAVFKRRRFLFAAVLLPIVIIGLVLALALPDVYRATARFGLVTDRIEETTAGGTEYVDQYIFGLRDRVLTAENLLEISTAVGPYPRISDPAALVERLRRDIAVTMVTQTVRDAAGRESAVYSGFNVSVDNSEPEKAAEVASALTNLFLDAGREAQLQSANNKVSFFMAEEQRTSRQIAQLESRLSAFKSANLGRLPEATQANITIRGRLEQELDGVEREIRTLQQNRVFVTQQLQQAVGGGGSRPSLRELEDEYASKSAVYAETHPDMVVLRRQIELLKEGGSVPAAASLEAQLEQKRAVLAEARQRYSDNHPDIRRLMRDIETLEARIEYGDTSSTVAPGTETLMSVQLQTQLNALDTQIEGLQDRAGTLRVRLNQLDVQIGATPEVEREYQEITRGLGTAREQFTQMVARRLDAEMDVAAITEGAADRFRLHAAPVVPWTPAGPPRVGFVVVSFLLGVMLSLASVVAREALDTNVRGTRDVRAILGLSPLGVIPEIRTSAVRARRVRRLAVLVGCLVVVAPVLYLVVHMAAS